MPLNNVRRPDLVATYNHTPAPKGLYSSSSSSQGMLSQSMPMAAMFMKNKFLAWFAVLTTWHVFLTSQPDPSNPTDSPFMKIGMAVLAVGMNYLGLFFPGTQPPPLGVVPKATSDSSATTTA
ncbi:uncharacterized protein KLLA0_B08415g [Kluyveromyces lactis]|uniref:KLLA0B08415p n=1 Tax=Kluyveromyces lactis (strain ATCC 8585 / CBS 2359 / DSM 70799 / NBRC 1267 / NRRL Y-1140 / WM37) TaxID=284590 RepID=Q6CVY6_KLULA|nr:uncharacterized protein KLLA0_B08415g [Kluyveromyces lactis]CAH02296.1 KLLA0B08415p [Kluyveromyces lactis]|eukprot:XP_451903.1 uncharacterized protein KLLA0_B08415g [Kluyveromyces lactis]